LKNKDPPVILWDMATTARRRAHIDDTPTPDPISHLRSVPPPPPEPEVDPITEAKMNPLDLRAAVKAKCWDCAGPESCAEAMESIGNCGVGSCPLHAHRPFQRL
jgi:hypothetical protein